MDLNFDELQQTLKNCGVIGAGGAGFPTYAKLNMKANTILLNCAECEPLLTLHRQLLTNKTLEILTSLQMIAKVLNVGEIIICVKREYEQAVAAVQCYLGDFENIKLKLLDSVYPMGDETVLIYESTKARIPVGKLPIDIGVIVFNVETIYNAYLAISEKKPVTKKLVTVTGCVNTPKTVKVPIGTTVSELLQMAGGINVSKVAYLIGGPMMGFIGSENTAVNKTTNAVLVLPKEHRLIKAKEVNTAIATNRTSAACCQCMACTDMCPRSNLGYPIKPHLFMRSLSNNNYKNEQVFLNTFFCCGCGICEKYACPQSLSPATLINEFKSKLRGASVTMPKDRTLSDVTHHREFRAVPEKRLEMSIDLHKYSMSSPLDNARHKPKKVYININQHIGAPLCVIVESGQNVKCGDVLASNAEALSACLHASIDGRIAHITKTQIVIEAV